MHQDISLNSTIESPLIPAKSSFGRGLKNFGRELVQTVLLMVVLFLGVRGVAQNFRGEGPSMQPTLTSGALLWGNTAAYFEWSGQYVLRGPQRGDIAVLRSPDTSADTDLIKRVTGVPGHHVRS